MGMGNNGRHLIAAALTPMTADGRCNHSLLAAHCQDLMKRGCEGILLFGTSGEGAGFSVAERLAALRAVIGAGVGADQLVMGLLGCALPDLVELAIGAKEAGCERVLMLPPFFFRDVNQDGLFDAFGEVIEKSGGGLRFFLYNFSDMCGSVIGHDLIARLKVRYPDAIAGVKDSAGDWAYTTTLLERFGDLEIYIGFEPHLTEALKLGARGSICGMANIIPETLLGLWEPTGGLLPRIQHLADFYDSLSFVPATKASLAVLRGDPGWQHVRAPLAAETTKNVAALAQAYGDFLKSS